jgi:hypothetical protein
MRGPINPFGGGALFSSFFVIALKLCRFCFDIAIFLFFDSWLLLFSCFQLCSLFLAGSSKPGDMAFINQSHSQKLNQAYSLYIYIHSRGCTMGCQRKPAWWQFSSWRHVRHRALGLTEQTGPPCQQMMGKREPLLKRPLM